jgi:hypothetical protein
LNSLGVTDRTVNNWPLSAFSSAMMKVGISIVCKLLCLS